VGSFKTRGAFTNLLTRNIPRAGIVAASGGNHGAAVAYASLMLGIPAKIFVPTISSPAKIQRIRGYRAALVVTGDRYADALAASEVWAAQSGALSIHAFDQCETLAKRNNSSRLPPKPASAAPPRVEADRSPTRPFWPEK
jgi:threonine dehydratase